LMNISDGPVDLTGAFFDRGIESAFAPGTTLAAGERAIVAARAGDFPGVDGPRVLGEFAADSRLDNGGEWLRLRAWDGAVVAEFAWDDVAPWPVTPDGGGPSLTLIAPATRPDPANPWQWRASTAAGGTPGGTDAAALTGDPLGDDDGDGLSNLCAHALGLELPGSGPRLPSISTENGQVVLLVPVNPAADDAEVIPEWSADLQSWDSAVSGGLAAPSRVEEPGGRTWLRFDSGGPVADGHGYFRVRVRLR
jgi:hypothetical protein